MQERNRKLEMVEFEGIAITVRVDEDTPTYAMALLNIFNNVRVNSELYYVENDYGNDITVYGDMECEKEIIDYLESFGEIVSKRKALCYQVNECYLPDYDDEKYEAGQIVIPFTE